MEINNPTLYLKLAEYLEEIVKVYTEVKRNFELADRLLKEDTKKRKFMIGNNIVWKRRMKEIIKNVSGKREKKLRPIETMRAFHDGLDSRDNLSGFLKDLKDYEDAIEMYGGHLPGIPEIIKVVRETPMEQIRFV
jgi:UbiD family decarboxylase